MIEASYMDDMTMEYESTRKFAEALLLNAINDYLGNDLDTEKYLDAHYWLFESNDEDFLSFNSTCDILELNKDKLRFALVERKDRGKKKLLWLEYSKLLTACGR
jgi:hypothetical protein